MIGARRLGLDKTLGLAILVGIFLLLSIDIHLRLHPLQQQPLRRDEALVPTKAPTQPSLRPDDGLPPAQAEVEAGKASRGRGGGPAQPPKEPPSEISAHLHHEEDGTPICQQNFGRIAIFIIYTNYAAYGHATNTLRCYALSRGYDLLMIQPREDERVQKVCGHLQDIFFLKHCAALVYLKDFDWFFVSDADTAVINADHCIEEFLHRKADVIMYERGFTSELTSGNYFVANTAGGRAFLRGWSAMEMETKGPEWQGIFTSSDNGLLHIHALRTLYPDEPELEKACWEALKTAKWPDYEPGFGAFLRCAKKTLKERKPSPHARVRMRIIPRYQGWVRDVVFTGFDLHPGDFMAHGIKHAEPFNETQLAALATFANGSRPVQCFNPAWRPLTLKGKMISTAEMRKRMGELGDGFERGKLRPLFADADFERCWPDCPMLIQNF